MATAAPKPAAARKSFEVNPWFNYYVSRDGRSAALAEAMSVGRETMTTPGPTCKTCPKPTWYRPLVDAYRCFTCQPGHYVSH